MITYSKYIVKKFKNHITKFIFFFKNNFWFYFYFFVVIPKFTKIYNSEVIPRTQFHLHRTSVMEGKISDFEIRFSYTEIFTRHI